MELLPIAMVMVYVILSVECIAPYFRHDYLQRFSRGFVNAILIIYFFSVFFFLGTGALFSTNPFGRYLLVCCVVLLLPLSGVLLYFIYSAIEHRLARILGLS
jgi:hypothetical protein